MMIVSLLLILLAGCTAIGGKIVERKHTAIGSMVNVNGIDLHYTRKGQGQTVVLLHGASANLRDMHGVLGLPLSDSYEVIVFDRPGLGYSGRPEDSWASPSVQIGLIKAALEKLGVETAVLVGHSWSGAVVMAGLVEHPKMFTAGVSISGATYPWPGNDGVLETIVSIPVIGRIFVELAVYPVGKLILKPMIDATFTPEVVPEGYIESTAIELALRSTHYRNNSEDVRKLRDYLRAASSRYGEVSQPLLIMHGDADTVVWADFHSARLHQAVANSSYIVLDGAGHAPHHTRQKEVIQAIDDFITTTNSNLVAQ